MNINLKYIIFSIIFFFVIFFILEKYIFPNRNVHEIIYPEIYKKEIPFYLTGLANKQDIIKIKKGIKTAKNKKIVICGLCRNIGYKKIKRMMEKIYNITKYFKEYKIVLFENDSTDNTRDIIKYYCSIDKNIKLLDCCSKNNCDCKLSFKTSYSSGVLSKNRIKNMAWCRNQYLNYVKKNYQNYDYLMVVDMDLNGNVSSSGFFHSLGYDEWDAIFINGRVSTPGLLGIGTIAYDSLAYNKIGPIKKKTTQYELVDDLFHLNGKIKINKKKGLFRVISAFNGIGIYKIPSILNASYDSKTACEHIDFHTNMIRNGKNKLYINPKFMGYFEMQGPQNLSDLY